MFFLLKISLTYEQELHSTMLFKVNFTKYVTIVL